MSDNINVHFKFGEYNADKFKDIGSTISSREKGDLLLAKIKDSKYAHLFYDTGTSFLNIIPETLLQSNGGTGTDLTLVPPYSVLIQDVSASKIIGVQPKKGAFFGVSTALPPRFDTLPVDCGGTGTTVYTDKTLIYAHKKSDNTFELISVPHSIVGDNSLTLGNVNNTSNAAIKIQNKDGAVSIYTSGARGLYDHGNGDSQDAGWIIATDQDGSTFINAQASQNIKFKLNGVEKLRINSDGNVLHLNTSQGYFLKDSAGMQYGALYDNGHNLWIGATQNATNHHTGGTYISSGYNSTDNNGNETIFIAIPNATNNGSSNYKVFHGGMVSANRLNYKNSDNSLQSSSHYIDNSSVGINTTAKDNNYNFYVNGTVGYKNGHIYLTGAKEASSTGNTTQLVFGTPGGESNINNHLALSSNRKALVINPNINSTSNQIVLYLERASLFPGGINITSWVDEDNVRQSGNLSVQGTSTFTGDVYLKGGSSAAAILKGPTTGGTFYFPNTGGTFVTHATRGTAVGSASLPVFIASNGRATECTGSSIFSAFTSSGNTLSITISGHTREANIIHSVSNSWAGGTTAGPKISTTVNGVVSNGATIPSASRTASGIITTALQEIIGEKIFETLSLKNYTNNYKHTFTSAANSSDKTVSVPNYGGNVTISKANDTNPTSATTYKIPFYQVSGQYLSANDGFRYKTLNGTASALGSSILLLGNNTSSGTAGNKEGCILLYGANDKYSQIKTRPTLTYTSSVFYLPEGGSDNDECYGVWTASASAVGTSRKPVYVTASGEVVASSSTVGSGVKPVYMSSGTITASSSTVGSASRPVYMSSGTITAIITLSTAYGGTGNTTFNANRVIYSETATKLSSTGHYSSSTKMAINHTDEPSYNFYVNGTTGFYGDVTIAQNYSLLRNGKSSSWWNGRDNAMIRQVSSNGYSPILSMKTTNGTWEMGNYNADSWHDILLLNYKSDTSYAKAGDDNTVTHALKLFKDGSLELGGGVKYSNSDKSFFPIVSENSNGGSIGTATKVWSNGYFNRLNIRGATGAGDSMNASSANPGLCFSSGYNGSQPVYLLYTDYDSYREPAGLKIVGGTSSTPAWLEIEGSLVLNKDIVYTNGGNDRSMIRFITGDKDGAGIKIGGGGAVVIGSGESADALSTDLSLQGGSEQTYITSDNNIYFYTNYQQGADQKQGIIFNTLKVFYPDVNATGYVGASNFNWAGVHARNLTSNDVLNITSASTLYINSGTTHSIIFRKGEVEQGRFDNGGTFNLSGGGAYNAKLHAPDAATSDFYFPNTGGTFVTHATRGTAVGSTNRPVYVASTGRATICNTPSSGAWWQGVPFVSSGGVIEIGKYIDFHNASTNTNDYSTRIDCISNTANVLTLPSGTGTLAILNKGTTSYWGIRGPANDDVWIRTTSNGFIPDQSGSVGSGHASLGTSTWYFANSYIDNMYVNLAASKITYVNDDHKFVTMTNSSIGTNSIKIGNTGSTTKAYVQAENSKGQIALYTDTNRGIWDAKTEKWMIRVNEAGSETYIPNWASRGSASLPVYINSSGVATACTGSSIFSSFTSSTNTLSITVAGQTRTAKAINSVSNTWTGGTTAGPTIKTTVNGVAGSAVTIPSASASASGVVTTGAQTFAGAKTFSANTTYYNTLLESTNSIAYWGNPTLNMGLSSSTLYIAGEDNSGVVSLGSANRRWNNIYMSGALVGSGFYGSSLPSSGVKGQVFFKVG